MSALQGDTKILKPRETCNVFFSHQYVNPLSEYLYLFSAAAAVATAAATARVTASRGLAAVRKNIFEFFRDLFDV